MAVRIEIQTEPYLTGCYMVTALVAVRIEITSTIFVW